MPKFTLPLKAVPGHARGAFQLWNLVKGLNVADLARLAEAPFHLALIGTEDHTRLLAARLALESPEPQDLGASGPPDLGAFVQSYRALPDVPSGSLTLDADALTGSEAALAATLAGMAAAHPDLRISLARHVPAFRPAVSALLINESAKENAKMAMLSALPGVLPFTDLLLPATSLGDMILLTKNQGLLLLALAAAYGKEVDLKARTRELLPVLGSAFGWRTAARQLLGLVPGGVGVAVKGAVAYAGTYTVGKSASLYYSTGQTLSGPRLQQMYREALGQAAARVLPLTDSVTKRFQRK